MTSRMSRGVHSDHTRQESRSSEVIHGTDGDDRLTGDNRDNRLEGNAGHDNLNGGNGADILVGGLGADTLTGGEGPDVFLYEDAEEAAGDIITDFSTREGDRIDMTGLHGSFVFTGDKPLPFSGSVWFRSGREVLTLLGDTDGRPETEEIAISLEGVTAITAQDLGLTATALDGTINLVGTSTHMEVDLRDSRFAGFHHVIGSQEQTNYLVGGQEHDYLVGGDQDDTFEGGGGDDTIDGKGGQDTVSYEERTSAVLVTLDGGEAVRVSIGDVLEDTLQNIESLRSGSADDRLIGDRNSNTFHGGQGGDILMGEEGNDTLHGDDGYDVLNGGGSDDKLYGGKGNDVLDGEEGENWLHGGEGRDHLTGGYGWDTAVYEEETGNIAVSLRSPFGASVHIDGKPVDFIRGIEAVYGGQGHDKLDGGPEENGFRGGGGRDKIDGHDGVDWVTYDDKSVPISVTLRGPNPVIVSVDKVQEDILSNIENVYGGAHNDSITGDTRDNRLEGKAGHDVLNGGDGADTLVGGLGADTLTGGAGADIFLYNEVAETVDDTITDFNAGEGDRIDMARLGDAFIFTGQKPLPVPGSVWFHQDRGGITLFGDIDGQPETEEISISLAGVATITAEDLGLTATALDGAIDFSKASTHTVIDLRDSRFAGFHHVIGAQGQTNHLTGGQGDDRLVGGSREDVLRGGDGYDTLDGKDGQDTASYNDKTAVVMVTLNGANSVRVSVGGTLEDTLQNIENIRAGSADDRLIGDFKNNAFYGEEGFDELRGGEGDDALYGGPGTDDLYGDDGHDVIHGGEGNDLIDGGYGWDTVSYARHEKPVVISLQGSTRSAVFVDGAPEDTIVNIESIEGGSADDRLTGNSEDNMLSGGEGDDYLSGHKGHDIFYGGPGHDTIDGGEDWDSVQYGHESGSIVVTLADSSEVTVFINDVGEDTLKNIESIRSGSGDDSLVGDGEANEFHAGGGGDLLIGGGGVDKLYGEAGRDTLRGEAGADILSGGPDADTFAYWAVADTVEDLISDFSRDDGDKIEFRHIDADLQTPDVQKLTFSDMVAQPGSIWYIVDYGRDILSLLGDVDGDAKTHEINIKISGLDTLQESDLLIF